MPDADDARCIWRGDSLVDGRIIADAANRAEKQRNKQQMELRIDNGNMMAESRTLLPLAVAEIARTRRENDHWKQITKDYPMLLERAAKDINALKVERDALRADSASEDAQK